MGRKTYASIGRPLPERRNLVVLRTFSKIHGLAGMRIGYAIGHPDTLERLRLCAGSGTLASGSSSVTLGTQRTGVDAVTGLSALTTNFQPGDLLLTIDGEPATRFREVEIRVQKPAVTVQVLRDGAVLSLDVATVALDGSGVRRVVMWAGALLQAPYRDMAAQRAVEPVGVYVSYFAFGSPASRYGLYAGRRITQVDGVAVANLDEFLAIVRRSPEPSRAARVFQACLLRAHAGLQMEMHAPVSYG